jgi:hypothetical protein
MCLLVPPSAQRGGAEAGASQSGLKADVVAGAEIQISIHSHPPSP